MPRIHTESGHARKQGNEARPGWCPGAQRTTLPGPTATAATRSAANTASRPVRPSWLPSQPTRRDRRPRSARTKRALCDLLEKLSFSEGPGDAKRAEILPYLYRHAVALAEERAANLPGAAHDELVSAVGERALVGLGKLDIDAPSAQQAAYLDRVLHHALADACRALDPLGRGPRVLRRSYEARVEAFAQTRGALPGTRELDRILDDVVGKRRPTLRLIVGTGMSPAEAVTRVARADEDNCAGDPAEAVAVAMARRQVAEAIARHPDQTVREYLAKVAAGLTARRPADFDRRLGPTLPTLIASLVLDEGTNIA